MKITLRKANALQASIKECIVEIVSNSTATVDEFQEVEQVILTAIATFYEGFNAKLGLYEVLAEIRTLVGRANATSGINDALTEIAQCDNVMRLITPFTRQSTYKLAIGEIEQRVASIAEQKKTGSTYLSNLTVNLLTKEDVTLFKNRLLDIKRRKQTLQDSLLELNIRTEIELSAEAVTLLKAHSLL